MQDIQVMVRLRDDVLKEAADAGLLEPIELAKLIERELDRRHMTATYAATLDALGQLEPPMSQEEIDAELAALRAEKALRLNGLRG